MSYAEMQAIALDVSCDYCGAEAEQGCVTKSGGLGGGRVHVADNGSDVPDRHTTTEDNAERNHR